MALHGLRKKDSARWTRGERRSLNCSWGRLLEVHVVPAGPGAGPSPQPRSVQGRTHSPHFPDLLTTKGVHRVSLPRRAPGFKTFSSPKQLRLPQNNLSTFPLQKLFTDTHNCQLLSLISRDNPYYQMRVPACTCASVYM